MLKVYRGAPHGLKTTHKALAVIVAVTALGVAACGSVATSLTTNSSVTQGSLLVDRADLVDHTEGLVMPMALHVATGADDGQAERVVHTAQILYTFWNTGDSSYLDQAITPSFRGNTLPTGRPPGPDGPL